MVVGCLSLLLFLFLAKVLGEPGIGNESFPRAVHLVQVAILRLGWYS